MKIESFKRKFKDNVISIIIISHFTLSIIFDYHNIAYNTQAFINNNLLFYILGKIVFIGFVASIWCYVLGFFRRRHKVSSFYAIYLLFILIFIILTWPGIWRGDDIVVLNYLKEGNLCYWQHWFTSLYYFVLLNVLPFPGGIIIIQNIIIFFIIFWIIENTKKYIENKYTYLFLAPLLLPVLLDGNLNPLRATLCAYIELFIIFRIILLYDFKDVFTCKNACMLGGLLGVLSSWRPENIVYIPFVVFVCLFNKQITKINKYSILITTLSVFIIISSVQNYGLKSQKYFLDGNRVVTNLSLYNMTGFMGQFQSLLNNNIYSPDYEKDMKDINSVIDVNLIKEKGLALIVMIYSDKNEPIYITDEGVKKLSFKYIKLALYNPKIFLEERINMYKMTNGYIASMQHILCSAHIFDEPMPQILKSWGEIQFNNFKKEYIFNRPFDINLRKRVISALELKRVNDYHISSTGYTKYLYNVTPCLFIIIINISYTLWKKYYCITLLLLIVLLKNMLIFLTAPSMFFMYYFSFYVLSLYLVLYILLKHFSRLNYYKINGGLHE